MKQFSKNGLRLLLSAPKGEAIDRRYHVDGARLSLLDEIGRSPLR